VDSILSFVGELEWGPAIPQYFFFTGVSAAAFLISSLTYVFGKKRFEPVAGLALILALTVLLAAPLNLIADLAQPGRFYSLLFRFNWTSPMSWGVFLLTLYPLLIALEILFVFRAAFARLARSRPPGFAQRLYRLLALNNLEVNPHTQQRDHRAARALGIVGIPMALAVHGYTGFILYFAVGRPLWHTPLMPIIFLVSAVVSGLGLMILLAWLMVRSADGTRPWGLMHSLGILLGWSILADLALRGLWHGLAYSADPVSYTPVLRYLFQDHFMVSVVLELGLALVLPAVVMFIPALRGVRPLFLASAFFAAAGVWLFRWTTVIGGQEISRLGAEAHALPVEFWGGKGLMQVIGNWGLWLALFILFTWFLPWDRNQAAGRNAEKDGQADSHIQPASPGGVS
jgi:tetrathionate reductase subunit C